MFCHDRPHIHAFQDLSFSQLFRSGSLSLGSTIPGPPPLSSRALDQLLFPFILLGDLELYYPQTALGDLQLDYPTNVLGDLQQE